MALQRKMCNGSLSARVLFFPCSLERARSCPQPTASSGTTVLPSFLPSVHNTTSTAHYCGHHAHPYVHLPSAAKGARYGPRHLSAPPGLHTTHHLRDTTTPCFTALVVCSS